MSVVTRPSDTWHALGLRVVLSATLLCATTTVRVAAQTPAGSSVAGSEPRESLSEVVVTARRREETLQQSPVSVTALTSRQLTDFGVKGLVDYAKAVPGMSFGMGGSPYGGPAFGFSSTRQVVIRGVAGANTTSLYIDDIPIPSVVDPRVFDLERIEVLRGPQGTLFGASSMGGTVRLITKAANPGLINGSLDAQGFAVNAGGVGSDVSGSINLPLIANNAALRLSVFDKYEPGYFTRVYGVADIPGVDFAPGTQVHGSTSVGNGHQYGGTASVRIVPEAAPGLSIVPLVVAQRFQVDGYPLADGQPDNFTQLRPLDVAESSLAQWQFYALRAQYTARFGDFIASTGYFQRHSRDVEDGTMWFAFFQKEYYSPLPYLAASVLQSYDSRELTQEIRFQSHLQVPVQFVAGFFYQRATTTDPFSYPIPGLDAATGHALGSDNIYQENGRTVAQQTAGFVDITYTPVDRMEVSAGVRKAWLDYSGHQTIEQPPALDANISYSFDRRQHPFTPRFLVKYSFDQNDMAYASASKGFRIGGENAPATGPCAEGARELGVPVGVALPYDSDSLWSYEFGLKNLWDDARIATRAAAYYIEWKNIQQTVLLPVCGIGIQLNSGAAGILGTEAELTARIRTGFEIGAGFAYEDGKITAARTLPSGQTLGFRVDTPLSGVPKWTASLRASYSANTLIGEAFVRTEYNFAGSSLSLANGGAGLFRSEYSLVDLHGGLHFDNSTAGLFVTNLFNKPANYGDLVTAAGTVPGRPRLVVAQPRTLGLEARHSFGAQ